MVGRNRGIGVGKKREKKEGGKETESCLFRRAADKERERGPGELASVGRKTGSGWTLSLKGTRY